MRQTLLALLLAMSTSAMAQDAASTQGVSFFLSDSSFFQAEVNATVSDSSLQLHTYQPSRDGVRVIIDAAEPNWAGNFRIEGGDTLAALRTMLRVSDEWKERFNKLQREHWQLMRVHYALEDLSSWVNFENFSNSVKMVFPKDHWRYRKHLKTYRAAEKKWKDSQKTAH